MGSDCSEDLNQPRTRVSRRPITLGGRRKAFHGDRGLLHMVEPWQQAHEQAERMWGPGENTGEAGGKTGEAGERAVAPPCQNVTG